MVGSMTHARLQGVSHLNAEGVSQGEGKNGRGGRIRTGDLLNPIQVRYRTALRPAEAHPSIHPHHLQETEPARGLEVRV
jgi:hypothetical protein